MRKIEETIAKDTLKELIELGYFKTIDGCFYGKCRSMRLMIKHINSNEMETRIKNTLHIYNRTLASDLVPRGIVLTRKMIRYVLKNLPVYKIELIKQEVK
ncbi:hypothetical protein H2512_11165 [Pasteurella multocida]|uniref:hypothetical protein n=1 Tax=Pasteurella multocida TaxID=747 RepID=UPI00292E8AC2|nr:hypothetical protein [Pasteurella multocida]WNY73963.1 hypothetical protein H2512_11165 [Pasteurella multocida]